METATEIRNEFAAKIDIYIINMEKSQRTFYTPAPAGALRHYVPLGSSCPGGHLMYTL